jgi:FkbM family methyltransferase
LKRPEHINISIDAYLRSLNHSYISNFIKIGSNDGIKNDPLSKIILDFQWKGIMVEPFEPNFNRLKKNFGGHKNLFLEQAGISDKSGFFEFYYITDIQSDEPSWYDQVGSFDRETFIKNIEGEKALLSRIGSKKIPCMTFDELARKYHFNHVDLIHIDTEGYDWKILRSIDLKKYQPKIIILEFEWLTQYNVREAKKYLTENSYRLYYSEGDCVAIKSI